MLGKTLGILELENRPLSYPGALSAAETFQFPIRRLTVPGASVRNVVDGDQSVKDAYVDCARQLESEGVAAIIANCGFSSLLQPQVSAAVAIPVALSSLVLVPLLSSTLPRGLNLGILTYDAGKLTEDHFAAAGWSSENIAVSVAGIEGSETWRRLAEPVPEVPPSLLISDVTSAALSLLKADSTIGAFVFECAAFPLAAEAVRRETGLRVADYVSLAKMVLEMSPPPRRSD